jgi:hypothetical protein
MTSSGLTRNWRRNCKPRELKSMLDPDDESGRNGTAYMPRWVKLSLIIGGIVVLVIVLMLLTGHRSGRHLSGPNAGTAQGVSAAAA